MVEQNPILVLVLRIASHVGHPAIVAAVCLGVAAIVFAVALRAKKPVVAWIAAAALVAVGAGDVAAYECLQSRRVYHVKVVVVRPDQSAVEIAQVKSSYRGKLEMVAGGWELDIPAEARPDDGKVTFTAAVKDEFLKGESALVLGRDYYPTATIQLVADTSAKVRGVVVDEGLRAVAGATVSIEGNSEVAVTDAKGNFVLPGYAGKGQMVEVSAQKGALKGRLAAPAGKVVEVILSSE